MRFRKRNRESGARGIFAVADATFSARPSGAWRGFFSKRKRNAGNQEIASRCRRRCPRVKAVSLGTRHRSLVTFSSSLACRAEARRRRFTFLPFFSDCTARSAITLDVEAATCLRILFEVSAAILNTAFDTRETPLHFFESKAPGVFRSEVGQPARERIRSWAACPESFSGLDPFGCRSGQAVERSPRRSPSRAKAGWTFSARKSACLHARKTT